MKNNKFKVGDPILYKEASFSGSEWFKGEIMFIANEEDFNGRKYMIKFIHDDDCPTMHYILVSEEAIKHQKRKDSLGKGDRFKIGCNTFKILCRAYNKKRGKVVYFVQNEITEILLIVETKDIGEVVYAE